MDDPIHPSKERDEARARLHGWLDKPEHEVREADEVIVEADLDDTEQNSPDV